ncbi:lipopolysaccharide kinase (Kdo/WaaP) family protein [Pseudomonas duriflava]|uniref:Lipopolysaccharide kinase (Kdo/WaaP) family protein n=1 Tax=Pseudomonas duriflava TaxID=459528 RepID=A0A562QEA3_9PSED|nr:lipopolysaccharide kinase InaA family protein [Pseudomonas duriflava]TWI55061.1 lipopolysaccharide kinase (Kdo/WaaP) family protein [Pseudomonas duriflava]
MLYLHKHGVSLPIKRRLKEWILYSKTEESNKFIPFVQSLINDRNKRGQGNRSFSTLRVNQKSYFIKTTEITQLQAQLRATFGWRRRVGGYGWPISEIINTNHVIQKGLNTPQLYGFGYKRSRIGLVNEVFLVTDWLENHVNGLEWLNSGKAEPQQFFKVFFLSMLDMHRKKIWHLDYWVENVVLSPSNPSTINIIDFENCYIGDNAYISETLGFQFGFIYYMKASYYISEKAYDETVAEALKAYKNINEEAFQIFYSYSKKNHIGRKERREIPLKGTFPRDRANL